MKNMHKASKLEIFVDSLIPYAIILIILITIVEVFFSKFVQRYFWIIDLVDMLVLFIFLIDLTFKFGHAKSVPDFLKRYWVYIIAVFPFFIVFRVLERFYRISTVSSGSTIILGRYLGTLLTEARIARFTELFRVLSTSTRLLRAVYFYEDPKIRHRINVKRLLGIKVKKR